MVSLVLKARWPAFSRDQSTSEANPMKSDRLNRIFSRTGGQCHICRKQLCFGNYGAIGKRGAWEIEHSRPRSRGGTDHLNNLYAACISCNRSKGNGTTASARGGNGYRAAPLSKQNSSCKSGIFHSWSDACSSLRIFLW